MERIALSSFFLYLLEIRDISLGTDLGEIDELICGHRKVEELKNFDGPYRQRRPYVRGCQSVP